MTLATDCDTEALNDLGEYFAAGFYSDPDASMVERFARAMHNWALHLTLPPYDGGLLYPSGPNFWESHEPIAVRWFYGCVRPADKDVLAKKKAGADERGRAALSTLEQSWSAQEFPNGFTHSIPNYGRVLAEGLDGFADRVARGLADADANDNDERRSFYRAMEVTLDAARTLHRRSVEQIQGAKVSDEAAKRNRRRLLDAYRRVPFAPAREFFDALFATNFIFYFDGCDNLGSFDQFMWPYYRASRERGVPDRSEAVGLVRALWKNMDDVHAWNAVIGGSDVQGRDLSNEFTVVCLEAARGSRRPNLALRLAPSTPERVWDAALDTIATGCGLPALYWDPSYFHGMRASRIPVPEEELHEFAFGGCTELMVHGKSNVGSLDDSLNVPAVLCDAMSRRLPGARTFEQFYRAFRTELGRAIDEMCERVNTWQEIKARSHPQAIRSLLIDDCVDTGREYSAGGARYNWSVINVMGLANAIDSLAALREIVFEKKEISPQEMAQVLSENFRGRKALRQRLQRAPRYGNGDPRADEIASSLSEFVFGELLRRRTWRGGPFVPSCLMFVTYVGFGLPVGATPDGRLAGAPIADSAGAYQGRDTSGPTAMLRSACALDMSHAPGTLVVNIRLAGQHFATRAARANVKALIRSYFEMGGLQLQVNVVDQQTLRAAVADPDRYADLIVRTGGYSEYWRNLTPELRQTVLERTEH